MDYRKPEIARLGTAVDAIQSSSKLSQQIPDSVQSLPEQSQAAYEADE